MSSYEFPSQQVWIYKDAIRKETVSSVYDLAEIYSKAPNYWIPKESLTSADESLVYTAAEFAIKEIYHTVAKRKIFSNIIGAEWWVQVYEGGSGLAFHFDKDEAKFKTEHQTRHPEFSSILYLTGKDEDRLRQACTVILDQRLDAESGKTVPESPASCVFVLPTRGKYCLFDGSLGHGVLDSSNSERRATLLINWWTEQPKDVYRPSKETLHDLFMEQSMNSGLMREGILLQNSFLDVDQLAWVAQTPYPVIRIPQDDEDIQESGILVDDLLDSYLLDSFGAKAEQAVCVRYSGHVLYPIDPLKTKQDISKSLIIPAAFIPEQVQVGP